jgi:hypothetical protein
MTATWPPALPEAERPDEALGLETRAAGRDRVQKHGPRLRRRLARLLALARPPGPRPRAARRPECVGLYLAALASSGQGAGGRPRTVVTIERRLSALAWNFAQRALPFDRKDRHVATVLAGVRRTRS